MMCNQQLLMWLWWAIGIAAWWASYSPILNQLRRWVPPRNGPRPDMGAGLAFMLAMLIGMFVWGAGLGFSGSVICDNPRPSIEEIRQDHKHEIDRELRRKHGL